MISSLVNVKYKSFPTILLYKAGFGTSSPLVLLNLTDFSMGTFKSLQANRPVFDSNSRMNFLWHKDNPFVVLATSNPKKYVKVPRYFSLKFLSSNYLNAFTASTSLLAIKISST